MNLQQRFLLWFADYRELRDENTRLGDELLNLRANLEEERKRANEITDRFMSREEGLNNRLLDVRFPVMQPRPERVQQQNEKPAETAGRMWAKAETTKFTQDVLKRRAEIIDGSGNTQPN